MRITCKTPSSGQPTPLLMVNVPLSFTTIADAPDFSVPDPGLAFPNRDPLDPTRAIRAGELFVLTPLAVHNKTATARWIEIQLLTEAGLVILSPGRVIIPARDTAYIQVQGRSLTKRTPTTTNGDRIQLRAEDANTFDVWGASEIRLSADNIGVVP